MEENQIGQQSGISERSRQDLLRLIRDNQDTVFGREHNFQEIRDIEGYRRNVPLSTYEDYEKNILAMRDGERNVLTAYEIAGYCTSSGTEGRIKYIPLTYEALSRYSDWSERYKNKAYREAKGGKRLFVNTFRTVPGDRETRDMLLSELYYRWMCERGLLSPMEYAGGAEGLFDPESENTLYAKVWLGFATEDIVLLEGIYLYDILNFFAYMERHWEKILTDMECMRIPSDTGLSQRLRQRLMSVRPDTHRLEKVRRECSAGFGNIAGRLWKGLRMVCGISSRLYKAEDDALKKYTGDISRYYFCYCASECLIGVASEENHFGYRLLHSNGFYEFLPCHEKNGRTLLPWQLEKDGLYEMVVTNFSGLYRYRMGDVLRVTGFEKGIPVLEFAFRRNQAFSLAGEKMAVSHLETAASRIRNKFPVCQLCFGVSVQKMPGIYYALVSFEQEGIRYGDEMAEKLAGELDGALNEVNEDYRDLRRMGQLERAEVIPVSKRDFFELMERHMPAHRHHKPTHVLPAEISEKIYREVAELYEKE